MRPDKQFTRMYVAVLFLLTAILLTGCGGTAQPTGHPTKASANKQVTVIPLYVSDVSTLDPALAFDIASGEVINTVFTGLVTLDNHLNVRPQLAASYQQLPDGLTWKFTLRPNLRFSDGTALTSQDVVYSIDRALQPAEKSTTAPFNLGLIKDSDELSAGKIKTLIGNSLLAPDPNTVMIVTNKQAPYFLDMLTLSTSYMVEKRLIDTYGTNFTGHLAEGGGDGPFKVAEYIHGQRIVLVPNPHYYGAIPQLRKLVMVFYKDEDTTYKAYQVGQVDLTGIPEGLLASAKQLTREFHTVPLLLISYYTMNYLAKPFDNIHIRQAFALAINKALIIHAIWHDAQIATNHILPQGMPGYNPDLTGPDGTQSLQGNPDKARQLLQQGLQEEGWTSVSQLPPIKLTYDTGSNFANEASALQQMWQTVLGVNVILNPVDFNKLGSELNATINNPQGLQFWHSGMLADYPDPQDWFSLNFEKGSPGNNQNYGQNKSPEPASQEAVQQQLEQADSMPSGEARTLLYHTSEQQLVNDVAWIPILQAVAHSLRKPCLVGWVNNNPGSVFPPNDWGSIYISTDPNCADTTRFQ